MERESTAGRPCSFLYVVETVTSMEHSRRNLSFLTHWRGERLDTEWIQHGYNMDTGRRGADVPTMQEHSRTQQADGHELGRVSRFAISFAGSRGNGESLARCTLIRGRPDGTSWKECSQNMLLVYGVSQYTMHRKAEERSLRPSSLR